MNPREDGCDAALRQGRYAGLPKKETPECPYPRDSEEADAWWKGFTEGLDIKRIAKHF